jgi:transposase InsO family protein
MVEQIADLKSFWGALAHDIQPSMSRIGNPYDKAESFIKTLKREEVDGRTYRDAHHARGIIGIFIEQVYNRQRLFEATPVVMEEVRIILVGEPRGAYSQDRTAGTGTDPSSSRAACR